MNIYLASGTIDYMRRLLNKHKEQNMILVQNNDTAIIIHETEGKTVFSSPRKYVVLEASGTLPAAGMVVLQHIPVVDEEKQSFEYGMKNRQRLTENQPGFLAFRFLRPLQLNTYVILTAWRDQAAFEKWKSSSSFAESGIASTSTISNMFSGAPYITTYNIDEEE